MALVSSSSARELGHYPARRYGGEFEDDAIEQFESIFGISFISQLVV